MKTLYVSTIHLSSSNTTKPKQLSETAITKPLPINSCALSLMLTRCGCTAKSYKFLGEEEAVRAKAKCVNLWLSYLKLLVEVWDPLEGLRVTPRL